MTMTATIGGVGDSKCLRISRCAFIACIALLFIGCAQVFYQKMPTGKFVGHLDVEWVAPNFFIYRPYPTEPLTYTSADGKVVRPHLRYTDGGSIPRLFWSMPHLGPWDFAPGFIIHDWLFLPHRCKSGDWQDFSFERSASVLAEALMTQMAQSIQPDPVVLWAIYKAVNTPTTKASWDSGDCRIPPGASPPLAPSALGAPAPVLIRILRIDIQ